LRYLIAIFTQSHFLSEEVLRHPEWADQLLESGSLHSVIPPEQVRAAARGGAARGLAGARRNSPNSAGVSCCAS